MDKKLEDIDYEIIRLYKMGMFTKEIGQQVGKSKGSICGLIYRYRQWGFLGPAMEKVKKSEDHRKAPPKRVTGSRPSIVKLRHFKEKQNVHSKIDAYQLKLNLPNTVGISFWDLKNNSCRYIVSGGDGRPHMYCGEPKEHKSYCLYHGSICYMKPEPRSPQVATRRS